MLGDLGGFLGWILKACYVRLFLEIFVARNNEDADEKCFFVFAQSGPEPLCVAGGADEPTLSSIGGFKLGDFAVVGEFVEEVADLGVGERFTGFEGVVFFNLDPRVDDKAAFFKYEVFGLSDFRADGLSKAFDECFFVFAWSRERGGPDEHEGENDFHGDTLHIAFHQCTRKGLPFSKAAPMV